VWIVSGRTTASSGITQHGQYRRHSTPNSHYSVVMKSRAYTAGLLVGARHHVPAGAGQVR
jgi:hypothetical protein